MPNALNPVSWLDGMRGWFDDGEDIRASRAARIKAEKTPVPEIETGFPHLSTVPPRPKTPGKAARGKSERRLRIDRERAKQSDAIVRERGDAPRRLRLRPPRRLKPPPEPDLLVAPPPEPKLKDEPGIAPPPDPNKDSSRAPAPPRQPGRATILADLQRGAGHKRSPIVRTRLTPPEMPAPWGGLHFNRPPGDLLVLHPKYAEQYAAETAGDLYAAETAGNLYAAETAGNLYAAETAGNLYAAETAGDGALAFGAPPGDILVVRDRPSGSGILRFGVPPGDIAVMNPAPPGETAPARKAGLPTDRRLMPAGIAKRGNFEKSAALGARRPGNYVKIRPVMALAPLYRKTVPGMPLADQKTVAAQIGTPADRAGWEIDPNRLGIAWIMEQEFYRIKRLPPYVFAEVNAMKAKARAAGEDIIDFGMGNPDHPSPRHVVDKLVEAANDPRTHRYSNSRGIPGLRKANAAYYMRRFNVEIDPKTETIVTLGSKEGFANLAMAITGPGDVVIVPNPTYPIHAFGFVIAGAALRNIPVGQDIDFMAELERAVDHSVPPPLALVLNFPANPTAQTVDLNFYEEVVAYCRQKNIYILSDLAYSEIYFEGPPPPSILQIPGARDIAVEFTSISKTYSMPGWRIGFATGNRRIIEALARIKSYLDYGAFTPIQVAATAALNGPQDCVDEIRSVYRRRRDVLVESFAAAGWQIPSPPATMFAWAPIPAEFVHLGSLEFSKLLLQEAKVAVSPGVGFGEYGEGFVRIALVENRHRIRQAARNVRKFLASSHHRRDVTNPRAVAS